MDMPALSMKLQEVCLELRRLGLWERHPPVWATRFDAMPEGCDAAFSVWLRHVYLPNRSFYGQLSSADFIAPQAMNFIQNMAANTRLLQLLVELDALI